VKLKAWLTPEPEAGVTEMLVGGAAPGAKTFRLNVFDTPPALALRMTLRLVEGKDPVAVKFALLWPVATVTLEGTLTLTSLLESPTAKLACAVPVSVTVQEEGPGAYKLDGEQVNEFTANEGGWFTVMAPPAPDVPIELPAAVAATTPPI
jgi:hypothetical protein